MDKLAYEAKDLWSLPVGCPSDELRSGLRCHAVHAGPAGNPLLYRAELAPAACLAPHAAASSAPAVTDEQSGQDNKANILQSV